jgi:hypothetical protein
VSTSPISRFEAVVYAEVNRDKSMRFRINNDKLVWSSTMLSPVADKVLRQAIEHSHFVWEQYTVA